MQHWHWTTWVLIAWLVCFVSVMLMMAHGSRHAPVHDDWP